MPTRTAASSLMFTAWSATRSMLQTCIKLVIFQRPRQCLPASVLSGLVIAFQSFTSSSRCPGCSEAWIAFHKGAHRIFNHADGHIRHAHDLFPPPNRSW